MVAIVYKQTTERYIMLTSQQMTLQTLQTTELWTLSDNDLNEYADVIDQELNNTDHRSGYSHKLQDMQDEIFELIELRVA